MSKTLKAIQLAVGSTPDGIYGPNTEAAIAAKLGIVQALTQADVRTEKSTFGHSGDEELLVNVPVPSGYPLTYEGKRVSTVRVHFMIAKQVAYIFREIVEAYGPNIAKTAPGLCVYSGSYNNRPVSNGSSKSMHAWGLALDFDAECNAYSQTAKTARLARPEYLKFWEIVESNGGFSLGRHSNCDWMHVQFVAYN